MLQNGHSKFQILMAMAVLSLSLALPTGRGNAAVWTVTTAEDHADSAPEGSLRRLLTACGPGDEIRFADTARTVTLKRSIALLPGANVTIVGPATIVQRAIPGDRLFSVPTEATCTMRDLTLTGGVSNENGGAVINSGTLMMERCVLQGNSAASNGGALSIRSTRSTTTLANCTVADNRALGQGCSGGGIYVEAGTLTMTNGIVKNNTGAFSGGGIFNMGTSTLTDCTIESNSADGFGGGIYHAGNTVLTLAGCTIRNNACEKVGGGICTAGGTPLLVLRNRCAVHTNTPDNIFGSYTSSGANFIGSAPNRSAVVFDGYAGPLVPTPHSTVGDTDVTAVSRDLADPKSALVAAVTEALSNDLGQAPGGAGSVLSGITASLYYANTFENVAISSRDLAVEYTASWPENVRYYALFARADGSGYEIPERGIAFEIRPGQPLPPEVTPPEFYVPGEGLMTWRNVVTDGGSFDLDPNPGAVTFRVSSIRAAATAPGRESGGGCDIAGGFPSFGLLLFGLPWAILGTKRS